MIVEMALAIETVLAYRGCWEVGNFTDSVNANKILINNDERMKQSTLKTLILTSY